MTDHWQQHNEKALLRKLPIAVTLEKALELLKSSKVEPTMAIDLGCGCGIDATALLEKGWQVVAVDTDKRSLTTFKESLPEELKSNFTAVAQSFLDVQLPGTSLINASFSLPFCHPNDFDMVWRKITKAMLPGGIFAGHFFGINDSWADNKEMTFHKHDQLLKLFENFTIESLEEIERTGYTLDGREKHWHVFHVVLRKR